MNRYMSRCSVMQIDRYTDGQASRGTGSHKQIGRWADRQMKRYISRCSVIQIDMYTDGQVSTRTLNEILNKPKKSEAVGQININGIPESDPSIIANHFNSFFTSIGKKISNDVPEVDKELEDYINYGRDIPE
jgi:hypothetical protein